MILVRDTAPLYRALGPAVEAAQARGEPVLVVSGWLPGLVALGAVGDDDPLDEPIDPQIDRAALREDLARRGVQGSSARALADALGNREDVVELESPPRLPPGFRPPTLFELGALRDVLGDELSALLPAAAVLIQRAPLLGAALNHCELGDDGVARIRLLSTNGTTLAGRSHALVHELGHALVGVARRAGRSYRAAYGSTDYGRFLAPATFDRCCDEEALVRAIADAWLLRRRSVGWTRTWPGAIDEAGRELDGDDLAAFARFRLAQGLGLPFAPIAVRRLRS